MALEKKKYKGGPSRKSYIQNMAKQGSRPMGEYARYGDYDPESVHDAKNTTYRGVTISNAPTANIALYSRGVSGEGYTVFRFNSRLYKHLNASGTSYEEVPV